MGIANVVPVVIVAIMSLVPVMVTIWAVLTLRDIQETLESMDGKLESIAQTLKKP